MEIKPDRKGIVVVGLWNPAIFTKEWMEENIFLNNYSEVTVKYPTIPINLSLEIGTNDFTVKVVNNQLIIDIISENDNSVRCLREILMKLPHTPIKAFGVNFQFTISKKDIKENSIFDFDNNINKHNVKYELLSSTKQLIYKKAENNQLNLNIQHKNNGNEVVIFMNYNYNLIGIKDIPNVVLGDKDDIVNKLEEEAKEFINNNIKSEDN